MDRPRVRGHVRGQHRRSARRRRSSSLGRHPRPYVDEAGEVSDEGWAAVEAYFANGSPAVEGTDLYARFDRDEVDYGIVPSGGIIARDAEYGTTTAIVPSENGVPFVTEQIGVIAGTDQEEQAQAFIDWFGSADVQGAFAEEFNSMPVNETAQEQANPEIVELIGSVERADIDYALRARAHRHLGGAHRARVPALIRAGGGGDAAPAPHPHEER